MPPESDLFQAYDPLLKNDPVYACYHESDKPYSLSIRPIWILGDLELLHDWFNSPQKRSNWELDRTRHSLFQHYKNRALSDHEQSFMIDQNERSIIQFDIFSVRKSYHPFSEASGNNYYLHYLYKENFRDPDIFTKGLNCMVSFLKSFTEIQPLHLQLPELNRAILELLKEIGFGPGNPDHSHGKPVFVFRNERAL
jgi:hypothetical protein